MKKIAIILIIFAFCTAAKATVDILYLFEHEKIRLSLVKLDVDCGFVYWHHKGLAKVLNDYIKEKIANGKLENKRFEVQIETTNHRTWSEYAGLQLTQGRNGYFVSYICWVSWEENRGRTSLEHMRAIVHSFTNPDWQPVLYPYWGNTAPGLNPREMDFDWDVHTRNIARFFEQNTVNEPFEFEPVTVWEIGDGVSMVFTVDGLRYAINGELLALAPETFGGWRQGFTLPIRIRDRFLFFQHDGIHVVEDMQTISTFSTFEWEGYDFIHRHSIDVHPKWINIHWGFERGGIWSYSYEQNRFFIVNPPYVYVPEEPVIFGESAVINGTRWATRNVDTSGTFAQNPENTGGFFTWYEAQNACPPGWRLPTQTEFRFLRNAGSVWMNHNGVRGRLFGIAPNQIFVPAAGFYRTGRSAGAGSSRGLISAGIQGSYWSGTHRGWLMSITDNSVSVSSTGNRFDDRTVRCVAE